MVNPPPEIARVLPGGLLPRLLPLVMMAAMAGMMAMMFVTGGRSVLSSPFSLMFPVMMLMSTAGMFLNRGQGKKSVAELNQERKDYFRYLDQLREDVRRTGSVQRESLQWSHPAPLDLSSLIGTRRMWERRPNDPDFGHVRIGIGSHRIATPLAWPETAPVEDLEPVATVALRRFVRTHSVLHELPTAVSLRAFPAVNLEGHRPHVLALVRAMLMELSAFHGPDHVAVAIVCRDPDGPDWEWAKWLPQLQHPRLRDGLGSVRMLYDSLAALEDSLSEELAERGRFMRNAPPTAGRTHLVVVIDDGHVEGVERLVAEAGLDSVTLLDLTAPQTGLAVRRGLQLVVSDGELGVKSAGEVERFATVDQAGLAAAASYARKLAPYRVSAATQLVQFTDEPRPNPGLMSLLGIADAAQIDPAQVWRPRTPRERLRVPIGVTPDGAPVELDIKEAAENGMGPHGLCVGATGSGKSEFLRTLVLSLVTTHSPDMLNLVLVDFKGGATFLGLDPLPHVAAVITNLEDELAMVDRMHDALAGELNRRQELLRSAGNFANVTEYERARVAGAPLDPLPALFIVVDEFSELLSQKPDFAELFVMIGRLGRSLRVHLLLASQRLEEHRLRGLESHLSYRIGLRTFSANESRQVLGITHAYHLPGQPGAGYLKTDAADPLRFNTCYVSGPYVSARGARRIGGQEAAGRPPQRFTAATVAAVEPSGPTRIELPDLDAFIADEETVAAGPGESLLQVVVARLRGQGRAAHEVWLPPLDVSATVDMLLSQPDWRDAANRTGRLQLPIGLIDKPYEQRRDVLVVNLAGAQGNVAVVGGPQSGKSTALRTLIMAAAATHTPEQVQFYCLDFGGGTVAAMNGLPHIGSTASRREGDRVRRTIAELTSLMRQREERFLALGIENMREFRNRKTELAALTDAEKAAHPLSADCFGDAFLVVDGWAAFREEFESLEPAVNAIAAQGLSYGVHLIITASRWLEIRPVVKDQLGTRIELRLGDPGDSEMNRRAAQLVPLGRPGRGVTPAGLHSLLALPRLDSGTDPADLSEGIATAKAALEQQYPRSRAPEVRMLPKQVSREEVLAAAARAGIEESATRVVIGLGESELQPVVLDLEAQPHLMIFADVACGKTTALRNIVAGIVQHSTPDQARFVLVDYRRTMLEAVRGDHLAAYSTSSQTAIPTMDELARYFAKRVPGSDITTQQLRDRDWWDGPEIYVVVDDYDMVAGSNPLTPLLPYLPQARDVGLHLIIARRAGGAGRALYDPVLGPLKDLSVDALLMSAPRDEGVLLGDVRSSTLPPGRGTLVSRNRPNELVQIADLPAL